MAVYHIERPPGEAPLPHFRFNLHSLLNRGLLRCYLFGTDIGNFFEVTRGDPLSFTNLSAKTVSSASGLGTWDLQFGANPTAVRYITADDAYRTEITTEMSVLMWADLYRPSDGGGSSRGGIVNGQPINAGYNWLLTPPSQSQSFIRVFLKTGGSGSVADSPAILPSTGDSSPALMGIRYKSGTGIEVFAKTIGGVGGFGSTTSKSGNVDTTDYDTVFGQWGVNQAFNGASMIPWWASIHNVALTNAEFEYAWSETGRWSLFREPFGPVYFTPSVAGPPPVPSFGHGLLLSGHRNRLVVH